MRILLVEDDEKLKTSLAFQLEQENFIVDTCFNADNGSSCSDEQPMRLSQYQSSSKSFTHLKRAAQGIQ